jgi:hypothetical protein
MIAHAILLKKKKKKTHIKKYVSVILILSHVDVVFGVV